MKLRVLQRLLGALRAVHWSHWTSHWQVKGMPFYGDHIMFERMYTAVAQEIDTLAEKIVADFGPDAVEPLAQIAETHNILDDLRASGPVARGLLAEELVQTALKGAYDALKKEGCMSLGMDDFLMATANAHDTHLYLLRQRARSKS